MLLGGGLSWFEGIVWVLMVGRHVDARTDMIGC